MAYSDLEIRILEKQPEGYPVEITLNGVQEFPRGFLDPGFLPFVATISSFDDGERIFRWLFADEKLGTTWAEIRGSQPLHRIRLRIDAGAPELHALPWELLRDPGDGGTPQDVASSTATPFSRYLAGKWQPGTAILKRPVKVLVAIANPENLSEFGLADIDVEVELAQLRTASADLEVELAVLPSPCTLPALEAALQQGYHILHFIGHGAYKETGGAALYLANEDNHVEIARDQEIAAMLARCLAGAGRDDDNPLRLVFLSSCETATRSPAGAFIGLAPRLVDAGLPAVLAMQDLLPVQTARTFSATFYRRLLEHGQVDLACNEARSAILTAELPGAAIPVLFMRLQNGQLLGWRGQILGNRAEGFWATLLDNIADQWCVPFLGPGVTAGLLPSPIEIAQELAADYNYPFPMTQSLPRVAQFIATLDNRRLREQTMRIMMSGFIRRMGRNLEPQDHRRKLSELISASAWSQLSPERLKSEIHHQLVALHLPLYVTTNLDNFMTLALQAQHDHVRRETVAWQTANDGSADRPHFDLDPPPSPGEPVVLHLFGTDEDLPSAVLTEDDYLDYLARIAKDYDYMLPTSVSELLASSTLLFLGYRLQDLDLKVILRGLLTNLDLARWEMLHVAVQIEADVIEESRRKEVIRYFQKYFASSKIDVYWGTAQQFVADLYARWQGYQRG
jgi:hypothetical protein